MPGNAAKSSKDIRQPQVPLDGGTNARGSVNIDRFTFAQAEQAQHVIQICISQ